MEGPGKGSALASKKNLKIIQKGECRNPSGTKEPKEVREMKNRNKTLLVILIDRYINMPVKKLNEFFYDPKTKTFDLLVIKTLTEGIKKGDPARFSFLLDRLVGKVTEVKDITIDAPRSSIEDYLQALLAKNTIEGEVVKSDESDS